MTGIHLADDGLFMERVVYLQWHLGNEVGRDWWPTSRLFYTAEFARVIDDVLADDDYGSNKQLIDSILPDDEPDREELRDHACFRRKAHISLSYDVRLDTG